MPVTGGPYEIGSQSIRDGFNLISVTTGEVVAWVAPRCDAVCEDRLEPYVDCEDFNQHPDARLLAASWDLADVAKTLLVLDGEDMADPANLSHLRGVIVLAKQALAKGGLNGPGRL